MSRYKQYEIWYVSLQKKSEGVTSIQYGNRPAIILQSNESSDKFLTITVAPLTSITNKKKKKLPVHVKLTPDKGGVKEDSYILIEQMTCIDQSKLIKRLVPSDKISVYIRDEIRKAVLIHGGIIRKN